MSARNAGLREYQSAGVDFLCAHSAALLGDEMGLGKTAQAIAGIATLLDRGDIEQSLVVTPSSLCTNWLREIERWAPDLSVRRVKGNAEDRYFTYLLPVQVLVTTYEQLRLDYLRLPAGNSFGLVVLDEAQRMKNRHSITALACRSVSRRRSWALTGTPLENHELEFGSILKFLDPTSGKTYSTAVEISAAAAQFMLRRQAKSVSLELPAKYEQELVIDMYPSQRVAYRALLDEFALKPSGKGADALRLLTRLRQLVNFDPETGSSAKLDALSEILEAAANRSQKVLVFSQFVTTLRWLSQRINYATAILHGGLSTDEKDLVIEAFERASAPFVLFVSLRAGGVGLNLQAASTVVLFDRWWNPAVEQQAVARAYRSGQTDQVYVYKFLTVDSIEERVQEILADKKSLFYQFVGLLSDEPSQPDSSLLRRLVNRELAST